MNNHKKHLIKLKSTIKEALIRLDELAVDAILFVIDEDGKLVGALTDGDVRRGLIKGYTVDHKIDEILQRNPKFIRRGECNVSETIAFREDMLKVVPILDKNDKVVNIINFRETRSYLPIDAVIMAGGRGQRLSPITDTIPKPLLRVGEKPIIEHNLDRLALYGITDFWVSVNYLGDQIKNFFKNGEDKDVNITYVNEDKPLGTIGAVSSINNFKHDYVLITNSDILTNLDYELFFLDFFEKNADMSVVSIPYQVNVPYAVLELAETQVVSFKEKPTYTYYSNGGIYLVKKSVLELLPTNTFYNTTDLMDDLIAKGMKVCSYPLMGYWIDIGNPEEYARAQNDIQKIKF